MPVHDCPSEGCDRSTFRDISEMLLWITGYSGDLPADSGRFSIAGLSSIYEEISDSSYYGERQHDFTKLIVRNHDLIPERILGSLSFELKDYEWCLNSLFRYKSKRHGSKSLFRYSEEGSRISLATALVSMYHADLMLAPYDESRRLRERHFSSLNIILARDLDTLTTGPNYAEMRSIGGLRWLLSKMSAYNLLNRSLCGLKEGDIAFQIYKDSDGNDQQSLDRSLGCYVTAMQEGVKPGPDESKKMMDVCEEAIRYVKASFRAYGEDAARIHLKAVNVMERICGYCDAKDLPQLTRIFCDASRYAKHALEFEGDSQEGCFTRRKEEFLTYISRAKEKIIARNPFICLAF